MRLPALADYVQAVQHPELAFTDDTLRCGTARCTPLGTPAVASGGFALTFDITAASRRFAVRCFHKEGHHLQERYSRVAEFIRAHTRWDFLVDVDYLPHGVLVEGKTFPIVRMPWIVGSTLSDWVEDNLNSPAELRKVQYRIFKAVAALQRAGVAHGDLQHGNILVRPDTSVQLVDYDGMFLPELRELGAAEQGHRHYQHPVRASAFDSTIDAFSAAVLDLSLSALQHEPQLWDEFHNGENLVFTATDFADPANSAVFDRIERLPSLGERTRRLRAACSSDFASVQDVLGGTVHAGQTSPRQTPGLSGPRPVHAVDTDLLRSRQGDEVTVFGRVHSVRAHGRGPKSVNINFGDYRCGSFTIYAFGVAIRELRERFGSELADIEGAWVCLTGLIELFETRWSELPAPQIQLPRARVLRMLTATQVEKLLDGSRCVDPPAEEVTSPADDGQGPAQPPRKPRSESYTRGGGQNFEDRLGELYSSANFGATVTPVQQNRPDHGAAGSTSSNTATPFSQPPPATKPTRPRPPPEVPAEYRVTQLPVQPAWVAAAPSKPPQPATTSTTPIAVHRSSKLGKAWRFLRSRLRI